MYLPLSGPQNPSAPPPLRVPQRWGTLRGGGACTYPSQGPPLIFYERFELGFKVGSGPEVKVSRGVVGVFGDGGRFSVSTAEALSRRHVELSRQT